MRRLVICVALVVGAFSGGMAAHAQMSSWGWWGAVNPIPISAANPLPVACQ